MFGVAQIGVGDAFTILAFVVAIILAAITLDDSRAKLWKKVTAGILLIFVVAIGVWVVFRALAPPPKDEATVVIATAPVEPAPTPAPEPVRPPPVDIPVLTQPEPDGDNFMGSGGPEEPEGEDEAPVAAAPPPAVAAPAPQVSPAPAHPQAPASPQVVTPRAQPAPAPVQPPVIPAPRYTPPNTGAPYQYAQPRVPGGSSASPFSAVTPPPVREPETRYTVQRPRCEDYEVLIRENGVEKCQHKSRPLTPKQERTVASDDTKPERSHRGSRTQRECPEGQEAVVIREQRTCAKSRDPR